MADLAARGAPRSIEVSAVVIRADGTVEPQGVIAEWHANPIRRLWAQLRGKGRVEVGN